MEKNKNIIKRLFLSYLLSIIFLFITYIFSTYIYIPFFSDFCTYFHILPGGMTYFGGSPMIWYLLESIVLLPIFLIFLFLIKNNENK
jgi:hypothetical protein